MTNPSGKSELKSILGVLLRNFILGHQLIAEFKRTPVLDKSVIFFTDDDDEEIIDVRPMYIDANTGKPVPIGDVVEQLRRSLVRATIAETHEAIQHYCNSTGQFEIYRNSSLYRFCRIMRNVVSHDRGGTLDRWPRDFAKRGINEVRWRNRKLSSSTVGQQVGVNNLEVVRLVRDQVQFVEDELD